MTEADFQEFYNDEQAPNAIDGYIGALQIIAELHDDSISMLEAVNRLYAASNIARAALKAKP